MTRGFFGDLASHSLVQLQVGVVWDFRLAALLVSQNNWQATFGF